MIKLKLLSTLLLLLLNVISLHGMEITSAQPEPYLITSQKHRDKTTSQLKDAYLNGKSSESYIAAHKAILEDKRNGKYPIPKKLSETLTQKDIPAAIIFLGERRLQCLSQKTKSQLLHQSASAGFAPFCQFLLEAGILHANCLDNHLDTPLHKAAETGHIETCKVLMQHGADVTVRNLALRTPLDNALLYSNRGCVRELSTLLLQRGAPATALRRIRENLVLKPLFNVILAHRRNKQFCGSLPEFLRFGMAPHAQDLQGNTLLHYVADAVTGALELMNAESLVKEKGEIARQILRTLVLEYQKSLELKGALTVLAIHKLRKGSVIALLPKDVLRFILMPLIMPFRYKKVEACVNEQLKLLASLLSIRNDTNNQTPYERLPKDARETKIFDGDFYRYELSFFEHKKQIVRICDLFDSNYIEQQREPLTMLTNKAMEALNQAMEHA